MSRWFRRAGLGVGLLLLGGCGTGALSPQGATPPRVRCLSRPDPGTPGGEVRPLVFLLCIQSP